MKIKLLVSGGFIPVSKEAVIDADISDTDWNELISAIEVENNSNSKARDSKYVILEAKGRSVLINPDKVPIKYKPLFSKLFNNLKRSGI